MKRTLANRPFDLLSGADTHPTRKHLVNQLNLCSQCSRAAAITAFLFSRQALKLARVALSTNNTTPVVSSSPYLPPHDLQHLLPVTDRPSSKSIAVSTLTQTHHRVRQHYVPRREIDDKSPLHNEKCWRKLLLWSNNTEGALLYFLH